MSSERVIIADSSPLIALARIGRLSLLPRMAGRIVVPPAVFNEVTLVRADAPGASAVAAQPWIKLLVPDPASVAPLLILVGKGEAEAIALAQRDANATLLIDDLRARKLAERLNIRRMGTVALLARAKAQGLIAELKPEFDALIANGIYIRRELIEAVLNEFGP